MWRRRWKWVAVRKAKRQGQIWVVADQQGVRGDFKFATTRHWYESGPIIANEYVAAALAERLGYPVAALEQATVLGPEGEAQSGIVTVEARAVEIIPWSEAPQRVQERPEESLHDVEQLASLIVFDAWIANPERAAGHNLILYRNDPNEKYDWYLTDHSRALYGSPRKWKRGSWNSAVWEQLWLFYRVPQGLLHLQSRLDLLEPMIDQIERLQESDINNALNKVPRGALRERERQFIKRLLLQRQRRLRSIIHRWLEYQGHKEYGNEVRGS